MCACEPGWTCPSCRDTPADDHHRDGWDEPDPPSVDVGAEPFRGADLREWV